ncbi:MAG: hypothetical protein J2P58_09210 [Acidimicrobiaceae bacterium]|nr:hypothetical protein [Acidimicrobiaceae bacterium]
MNWLTGKARSEVRLLAGLHVGPALQGLQERLEAVTEAQHADLRRQVGEAEDRIRGEVAAILPGVRAENAEVVRMLRQQGDASDEVAEILGRTLARLGAEVDALSQAVERLQARLDDQLRASAASGLGDPLE